MSHDPLCPMAAVSTRTGPRCDCALIARVSANEKAKADLVITMWEQEVIRAHAAVALLRRKIADEIEAYRRTITADNIPTYHDPAVMRVADDMSWVLAQVRDRIERGDW